MRLQRFFFSFLPPNEKSSPNINPFTLCVNIFCAPPKEMYNSEWYSVIRCHTSAKSTTKFNLAEKAEINTRTPAGPFFYYLYLCIWFEFFSFWLVLRWCLLGDSHVSTAGSYDVVEAAYDCMAIGAKSVLVLERGVVTISNSTIVWLVTVSEMFLDTSLSSSTRISRNQEF